MKSILSVLLLLASLQKAHAQSFYHEECDSNATQVNVKTGEILDPLASRMVTHTAGVEWSDDNKVYKIVLEKVAIADSSETPMIQQVSSLKEAGPKPNQKLATTQIKDFIIGPDNKVQTKQLTAKNLVTIISDTESINSDAGGGTFTMPDFHLLSVLGPDNRDVTTQTMTSPMGPIDGILTKTSVSVCTTTPIEEKSIKYDGFFAGVKNSVKIFQTQFSAKLVAKKALADCQAKTPPADCSALQKKLDLVNSKVETLWTTLVKAPVLPKPKPDPGTIVIPVPGDNSCGFTSQCPVDEACINHQCARGQCTGRSDCNSNESCVNGACATNNGFGCNSSSDCQGSEQCVLGICTSDRSKGGCHQDGDCDPGMRCGAGNICSN